MKPQNLTVILVCPESPDNIGAVARAVKNMGFSRLRLVNPPRNWRSKGKKMAMSAEDTLNQAETFSGLKEAGGDLQVLFGMTRRASESRGRFTSFPKAVSKMRDLSQKVKVGLVFGCESKGLANKDIRLCDELVTIPTGKAYPSLNLAQAVMVVLFSIATGKESRKRSEGPAEALLSKKEIDATMGHFEKALRTLGYHEAGAELLPRILQTTRGLIKRSGLLAPEAQMIKGLSRRIQERVPEAR
jgi:tRNA/rRNA methyltransferase